MRPNFNLFKSNPFDKYRHFDQEYFPSSPQKQYNLESKSKDSFWIWALLLAALGFIGYIFRDKIISFLAKVNLFSKEENLEDKSTEVNPKIETSQDNSPKQLPEVSKDLIQTEIQNEDLN